MISIPSSPLVIGSSHSQTLPTTSFQSFHFPETSKYKNLTPYKNEPGMEKEFYNVPDKGGIETQKSSDSEKTVSVRSDSISTDSEKTVAGRLDSQGSQISEMDEKSWPRQNSLTMKEWDIPYD